MNKMFNKAQGRIGVITPIALLWAYLPITAQVLQIQIDVVGDFLLRSIIEPPQLHRWMDDRGANHRIPDYSIFQSALSDLADRNQEAHRKLRELKWLEIKSLENVQYILDIQNEPWWVRAPTVRYLSDGAGSLVESKIISSYPTTLQARVATEACDIQSMRSASGKKYAVWIGYSADGNGKIFLSYII